MAHKRGLDGVYLQPTREECFAEFVKAIPDLTIDQAERQKAIIQIKNKKIDIEIVKKEISKIKSELYEKLGMKDEAFLAAQEVLNEDMKKIKNDAIANKCSVFHQFCQNEYEELDAKNKNSSE